MLNPLPHSRSTGFGRCLAFTLVLVLLSVNGAHHTSAGAAETRKVIEWGWGTPEATYIRDHVKEMERLPFDGLGLDLRADGGPPNTSGHFSWNVWGAKALRKDDYAEAIGALCGTQFERFTDNFLRFNVTPGNLDWYDQDFTSVLANARLAARVAKECRLKGLLFDVEHYGSKLFRYPSRPQTDAHTFSEYQTQVRQRGREFMQAIREEYPGISILLTYGYQVAYQEVTLLKSLATVEYGLLPAFLDGMLDTADAESLIFDGWEFAYKYKQEKQFTDAYDIMLTKGLERAADKERFRQHYRASFGIWLDHGGKVWDQQDLTNNYFTPAAFEAALGFALKHTDRYVWIYSHKARWWDGQVPQAYIDALRRAREGRE